MSDIIQLTKKERIRNTKRKHRYGLREYSGYGIIYKITLYEDGRCYIGQTRRSLVERLREHQHRVLFSFQEAMKEHGAENFIAEIVEVCDSQETLDERESYWVRHLKSDDPAYGFNLTSGGKRCVYSEEARDKIRNSMIGCKNHMFGKKQSLETIAKRMLGRKGKPNTAARKAVYCLENRTAYESVDAASKMTGINLRTMARLLNTKLTSPKYRKTFLPIVIHNSKEVCYR